MERIPTDSSQRTSYTELAEALGISNRMVRKHINTLKAKGLITRIGSNKTGHCFQIGKRSDTARLFENHGYKN
ncbi:winged helix-turn-helix transcriptional regulator [Prevotella pectinovora]|uniref:winged helix-turn-helix transcriptional regulator n=1 Tax=Prevotella pectinovora TaxID=1602169 RepID=UPI003A92A079